jgi:hypothetical protein
VCPSGWLERNTLKRKIHECESLTRIFTFIVGTTVGYGDVTVSTDEGKLFLAIYAILVSYLV